MIGLSYESIAEMTIEPHEACTNNDHFGSFAVPIRVLSPRSGPAESGPGWQLVRQSPDFASNPGTMAGDCWRLEAGDLALISVDDLARSGLPVVVVIDDAAPAEPGLVDHADAFIMAGDDPAAVAAVYAAVTARRADAGVRDLSDGTAQTINALSAEASRIASALARLADTQREPVASDRPVDAVLVRRILKLRRDRDRFFPAELFADPAWDMLLDLAAARLEGKPVPVSSLCIAAAVPTTTALRWVRSLSEAGLLERRLDPDDARRTFISLADPAAAAMMNYLRLFSEAFVLR